MEDKAKKKEKRKMKENELNHAVEERDSCLRSH